MELVELAKIWWYAINKNITRREQPTTKTWDEVKAILRQKYLPPSQSNKLRDQAYTSRAICQ